jgi:hypothetical protein
MRHRLVLLLTVIALAAAACSSGAPVAGPPSFGPAPAAPGGPLAASVIADLDLVLGSIATGIDPEAVARLGQSDDVRIAWLMTDLLRFVRPGSDLHDSIVGAWESLTGVQATGNGSAWGTTTGHMIGWDTPAPPGYRDWKRQLFELVEPGWAPFFSDPDADIDWRLVSWGGVLIDDRPLGQTDIGCPEGCIPALNDPDLTDADGGDWYPDDRVVFGVIVDGRAVAFPKNIMEVHEMVNTTIAGRRIGMPYCTLCGSAQAYFTDDVSPMDDLDGASSYELRTSGLLSRSNKVMYEFHTKSVFDTFTGRAVTGPLREQGVVLEQITVQTATWADWKAAHPETLIVAQDGGIGRSYSIDPLGGRDDDGPIFPIGDVDPRLPVQEPVVGVVTDNGSAIAFPVAALDAAFESAGSVDFEGVIIETDGAGYSARSTSGAPLAAHQAFWFAWSQFHPGTQLWEGG